VVATDPAARLKTNLEALDRAYEPGHHGRWSAARRAEIVDEALVGLFERAGSPARIALAALGGYGRRLQLPGSDVDLLILHGDIEEMELATIVGELLYPLWDLGLSVGQAVRTPNECLEVCSERLDALTAMLDARYLCGDRGLVDAALVRVLDLARADPVVFARRLAEARERRRGRYGSAGHLLEPDLKEAVGGLRDVASVGWLERSLGSTLEASGFLRGPERDALDEAEEFLVRARSALHLETERRTDRLIAELQPDVADAMGFADEPRLPAVDGLMRALFAHARQVEHVTSSVFDRIEGSGDGGGRARPPSQALPGDTLDAQGVLEALADLAERGAPATVEMLDRIWAADVEEEVSWTDGVRDAFLRLLRSPDGGTGGLDVLDRLGLLARYLPAWAEVRCRPQRDPYHRWTVDTHLSETLGNMAHSLAGATSDDPVEVAARAQVADPDAVRLGALLHDIGKTGAGDHVPAGARIAAATLDLMHLPRPTRDLALFMVEQHLLLSDTATRRDLTDENLVIDVAATIGTPWRLAALYLLAKADAQATGPAAWTAWRRSLVRELVAKVQRAFDRGEMGAEIAARLNERVGRVRDLLASEPDELVDRFVLRMPRGYFLAIEPEQVGRQYTTIAPAIGTDEVRTATVPGARPGTFELLVVARDRPGLLSQIAGALTLAGLSILTAQVFTTDDGVAVDVFEVEGAFEGEAGQERWREFRKTLRRAIEGRISLDQRVDQKRRHYPPPGSGVPVTVKLDNDVSEFATVVEVGAPDRIGLLYDVTRTFADLKLDVRLAKVATYTGRVIDSFYVRDALGRKVTDAAQVREVEDAVRHRLDT
jgi:[protein-PII] uridylyltransferase